MPTPGGRGPALQAGGTSSLLPLLLGNEEEEEKTVKPLWASSFVFHGGPLRLYSRTFLLILLSSFL